jgi:uroporphyrinogen-III decarboxylase
MVLDGDTDIYRAKEDLRGHMCIMGDVPAGMLYMGNPDQVRKYCTKLIEDMEEGFILQSGCDIPMNAKLENVQAMPDASEG